MTSRSPRQGRGPEDQAPVAVSNHGKMRVPRCAQKRGPTCLLGDMVDPAQMFWTHHVENTRKDQMISIFSPPPLIFVSLCYLKIYSFLHLPPRVRVVMPQYRCCRMQPPTHPQPPEFTQRGRGQTPSAEQQCLTHSGVLPRQLEGLQWSSQKTFMRRKQTS